MIALQPELAGATERFLIDGTADAGVQRDVAAAAIGVILADAAGHTADALPELLILSRGGKHFDTRLRPYLNEVVHCLASALEAALLASRDAVRAGIGAARKGGEDELAVAARVYLDQGVQ